MGRPHFDARDKLKIRLALEEEALLADLRFDISDLSDDARQRSLNTACALAKSLVARGGIPKARWRYFIDPELNVGAGRSRKEALEADGVPTSDILCEPRFLPTLHYWIYGPELPPDVINAFMVAAAQHSDLRTLRRQARRAVRERGLPRHPAGDEFFKLALEAGLDTEAAWSIRTAVHSMRTAAREHAGAAAGQNSGSAESDSTPGILDLDRGL